MQTEPHQRRRVAGAPPHDGQRNDERERRRALVPQTREQHRRAREDRARGREDTEGGPVDRGAAAPVDQVQERISVELVRRVEVGARAVQPEHAPVDHVRPDVVRSRRSCHHRDDEDGSDRRDDHTEGEVGSARDRRATQRRGRDEEQSHGPREIDAEHERGRQRGSDECDVQRVALLRGGRSAPLIFRFPRESAVRRRVFALRQPPSLSMFLLTTSSVSCNSFEGLNSTTSVPAYSTGVCPGPT